MEGLPCQGNRVDGVGAMHSADKQHVQQRTAARAGCQHHNEEQSHVMLCCFEVGAEAPAGTPLQRSLATQ